MRRRMLGLFMVTAGFMAAAVPLTAQTTFGVMGGATVPMGEYKEYAKTGWVAGASLELALKSTLGLKIDGTYGMNSHSDYVGDKTTLMSVNGSLVLHLAGSAGAQPYLQGGVGLLSHKYSSTLFPNAAGTESGMAISGGIGVNFGSTLFAEGRYVHGMSDVEGTNYIAFVGGIHFGGKKK